MCFIEEIQNRHLKIFDDMPNELNLQELQNRLQELSRKQEVFAEEIRFLSQQLEQLLADQSVQITTEEPAVTTEISQEISFKSVEKEELKETIFVAEPEKTAFQGFKREKKRTDLEKIIGENWINKVGILILIIGVFLGAKYSIENDLINPLTRIVLGYLSGAGLLVFGIKLKAKYEAYSAVLVSGAMTIFYFITFFAYDFYGLIPQWVAFLLMVIFTIFAALAALNYDKPVIAHIGLVGAYAIPFLLSSGSGRVDILFSYVTIINTGILIISVKKYWKSLFYSAFFCTWLIFCTWFFQRYDPEIHQGLAFLFITVFFLQFYAVVIVNRILQEDTLAISGIILLLLNSFVYFLLGLHVVDSKETTSHLLGMFTLFNALIHFVVAFVIRRQKLVDKTTFYLIVGLVFTFLTLAVPIQLNGSWVTLFWIVLSVLLFWVGRTKQILVYERIAVVIAFLSFMSFLDDLERIEVKNAFFNQLFMSAVLLSVAYGFILRLLLQKKYDNPQQSKQLSTVVNVLISVFLGITLYVGIHTEIDRYFHQQSGVPVITEYGTDYEYSTSVSYVGGIVLIVFSILYFTAMSFLNILKIKKKALGIVSIVLLLIAIFNSQTTGIYILGYLRDLYLESVENQSYNISFGVIFVRYLLFGSVALGVVSLWKHSHQECMQPLTQKLRFLAELATYVLILFFLSNELVTWLALTGYEGIFKLGLSILWGVYSLILIYLGIFKRKKYLRIGAFILFGITLLKLFFYDIAHLNAIPKILVFISLGVILLVASFLYNKFKDQISEDEKHI